MNRSIAKALMLDAYYQVLDNRVFRLLLILSALLILPTLIVGARSEGIVILFGVKTIPWTDLMSSFGGFRGELPADFNKQFIAGFQQLVVQNLAGTAGLLFCIAATAFFIPRMLEKGSADVVFSRPVSRATLLITRYFAGVIFVALLSSALVIGIHCGLLLVSGYSDPAFLWNVPALVYVFALVHAVSTLVAVFTRSSVAAILTALMFFMFNGCIHRSWIAYKYSTAEQEVVAQEARASGEDAPAVERGGVIGLLTTTLNLVHHVLPKTTDADLIVNNLRETIQGELAVLEDPRLGARISTLPDELELVGEKGQRDLRQSAWTWRWTRGTEELGQISLQSESRTIAQPDGRNKRKSARATAREFLATLPAEAQAVQKQMNVGRFGGEFVRWQAAEQYHIRSWTSVDDDFVIGEVRASLNAGSASEVENQLERVLSRLEFQRDDPRALSAEDWYKRRLSWSSAWYYNYAYSIVSSLLFAALLLAISCWRLSRIDF